MVRLISFLVPIAIILLGSGLLLTAPLTRPTRALAIISIVLGVIVFAAMLM